MKTRGNASIRRQVRAQAPRLGLSKHEALEFYRNGLLYFDEDFHARLRLDLADECRAALRTMRRLGSPGLPPMPTIVDSRVNRPILIFGEPTSVYACTSADITLSCEEDNS